MKLPIVLTIVLTLLSTSSAMAYRHGGGYGRSYHGHSYGGTHTVRTYTRRNGTVVHQHLSGNPGSGIHCHNNSCY